ncbi:MAG: hypothetical protein IJT90_06125 [Bacteroidaceae bacterium]|nr:hypothetical protein [Bacteroidaceae bacterium]
MKKLHFRLWYFNAALILSAFLFGCPKTYALQGTVYVCDDQLSADVAEESVDSVIIHIERIYDSFSFVKLGDESYNKMFYAISSYFEGLPKTFNKKDVVDYYYEAIVDASEKGYNTLLLRYGIIYLGLGVSEDIDVAYKGIAQSYANNYDKNNLDYILSEFKKYSVAHNKKYSEDITQLYKEYSEVLNPVPFEDKTKGVWATANIYSNAADYKYFPYSIIRIDNILSSNGIYLLNYPGKDNHVIDWKINSLRTSQQIGGHNGFISAIFCSENLKRGNSSFAQSGFESTRQFRANMSGEIAAAKTSFGNKLLAGAITEGIASVFNGLFSSTAQSKKRVAALNLNLNYSSSNLLKGNIEYWDYTVNVNQMHMSVPPLYKGTAEYVRWEAEDNIYFVNSKNKVYSVTPIENLDLSKYNQIKKKYSLGKAKYIIPIIGGELIGGGVLAWGIVQCCGDLKVYDKNGNIVYNEYGNRKVNTKKLTRGVIISTVGYCIMLTVPMAINSHRIANRRKAFNELNKDNFHKLQRKAAKSLSLGPVIEANNTYGLRAELNF